LRTPVNKKQIRDTKAIYNNNRKQERKKEEGETVNTMIYVPITVYMTLSFPENTREKKAERETRDMH